MATDTIDPIKLDINNLDKSDWKTYRFDEIAQNISERVDPNDTDLEVYVGLEHLDSESLHITRHGTADDVNGTKLRFYKGDIIFGRRRAYQRKAGIATCDGFCSAHALVLRANPDVIDPDLFPFFIHSDLFMNRAIDISVGSLSPTINWGTLKHQEFLLPPKQLHSKLSQLFWSSEESSSKTKTLLVSIDRKKESFTREFFKFNFKLQHELLPTNWRLLKAKQICDLIKDGTHGTHKNVEDGHLLLSAKDIVNGEISIASNPRVISNEEYIKIHKNYELKNDDLLVTVVGSIGGVAIIKDYDGSYTFQRSVAIMRFKNDINSDFIYHYMKSIFFQKELERKTVKSVQSGVYLEELGNSRFIIPDEKAASKFVKISSDFSFTREKILATYRASKALQKSLINQVF